MIVLDTNVVSEVMKVSPSKWVVEWLNALESNSIFISTVSIGEIAFGLRVLPDGNRRRELKDRFEKFVAQAFIHRVLDFDEPAARIYGEVMGHRRELGRPMSVPDGQIAAIARTHGFSVGTRNVSDFEECGVELINPFLESC